MRWNLGWTVAVMVCKQARMAGLERGFGGTLDIGEYGVGEGEVHRLRLCGDTVDKAVRCGLKLCLQGCGNMAYEEESAGKEGGNAYLMIDLSGIDRWLRSGSCKVGIVRGHSQGEGM